MRKKTFGFDKKILLYTCALMIVLQMIVTTIGFSLSSKIIGGEEQAKVIADMKVYSHELDSWINGKDEGLNLVGRSVADFKLGKEDTMKVLNDQMAADSTIMESYVCYPDDSVVFASGIDCPEGLIVTERAWYIAAEAADGKMISTEPYIDANTGALVITAAKAIKSNGELYCIVGADITLDEFIAKCSDIQLYDKAYAFLMSEDGNFIVHENPDFLPAVADGQAVFTNVKDVPQYAGQQAESDTVFESKDYNNKKVMICMSPLSNGWMLGYSIDYREYSSSSTLLEIGRASCRERV